MPDPIVYLPFFIMLVLLVVGVPIAYTMLLTGVLGVVLTIGFDPAVGILMTAPHEKSADYVLSTIPLFILMAMFLSESGLTRDIFRTTQHWLGHIPGGLAIATTIANGMMAVLSGSSTATAATMAKISYDEMKNYEYDERLIVGTVSAAGTFAIMLPPSLGLILYGVLTENNIGLLFLGGIIPGIITLVGYALVIILWVSYDEETTAAVEKYSFEQRFESLRRVWPAGVLVLGVLGGIYSGIITVTEAGAIGAMGAFLIGTLIYGLGYAEVKSALHEAVQINGMIFIIIIAASIFGYYITVTRVTQQLVTAISNSPLSPIAVLVLLLGVYIALGTVMDQLAVLILTLPITYPLLVEKLAFGPIWFGVLIVKTIEIGLVTPPFGLNVYIASGAVDVNVGKGFRGAARFLVVDFVVLALMIVFPEMITWVHGA